MDVSDSELCHTVIVSEHQCDEVEVLYDAYRITYRMRCHRRQTVYPQYPSFTHGCQDIPFRQRPRTSDQSAHSRLFLGIGTQYRCVDSHRCPDHRHRSGNDRVHVGRTHGRDAAENIVRIEICTSILRSAVGIRSEPPYGDGCWTDLPTRDRLHHIDIVDHGLSDVQATPFGCQDVHVGRCGFVHMRRFRHSRHSPGD